jgi:hypothetical protein
MLGEKMNKGKKIVLLTASTCIAVLSAIYLANYIMLQQPFSDVIKSDPRNEGINFSVHYAYYVYPSELVIDVKDVKGDKSTMDVFRVLLQYAEKLETTTFDLVKLASKGKTKFILEGKYFKTLGEEYGTQNPVYTMRTYPDNLHRPDGTQAFGTWTGGIIGVFGEQMNDFNEFHQEWYIKDMALAATK